MHRDKEPQEAAGDFSVRDIEHVFKFFAQELYERSLRIKSAIPHPRIMAVIRECGGKMHMRQREWDKV